ncbi:GWxTD domain-containing protein [Sanyastnella coralliicola]|uniref:GWxTD domain-containing protein n=1 Tax=Sanyastnella coralliicola TaxID=3069118 RepID=UPI0027BAD0CF|nr:GWxTD domain-containing protein [Longitalea sp. SCSIO 12813]
MNKWLLFCCVAALLSACSVQQTKSTTSNLVSYDWEVMPMHPEVMVYHTSDSKSMIYLGISSSELLFARNSPESPFEARLDCDVMIERMQQGVFVAHDTTDFVMIYEKENERDGIIISSNEIDLETFGRYRFTIQLTDLNRRWSFQTSLEVNKFEGGNKEDYLFTYEDGLPVFGEILRTGELVKYTTSRGDQSLSLRQWQPKTKLPPPPYVQGSRNYPSLPDTTSGQEIDKDEIFFVTEGLNTMVNANGDIIHSFLSQGESYPEIKSVDDMMFSLRYISGRREYERIEESNYRKKEIDAFWLDCGGSKDRTRELIKIYYRRVEEANRYFSSSIEGWKTDRGLIHIVFGNPTKITRDNDRETWIYGEENNLSSITFNFYRERNPLSDNLFVLERNPLFRTDWDRAVTAWRNGRIFQE